MTKILLIVGLPGSGKTTAADILKKYFKIRCFHSGDIIRDEIRRRALPYTPENDTKISNWFHSNGRERLIASRTWKKIRNSKYLVLEGFRNKKQLKFLEKLSGQKIPILTIACSREVRARRLMKRHRFGRSETLKYVNSRDMREKKHGIMSLIKRAHLTISNTNLTKSKMKAKLLKSPMIKKWLKNNFKQN